MSEPEPEPERNALAAQTRNASALPEIVGKRELAEYLGCHTKPLERRVAKGERPRPMTLPSGRGYWSGERIARELDAVIAVRIRPALIVSDNGTESPRPRCLAWQQEMGIGWHLQLLPRGWRPRPAFHQKQHHSQGPA